MKFASVLLTLCMVAPAFVFAQEEDAVRVFKSVSGSVVSLQNIASSGTGLILDTSGLIITNAHVIAVPLPFQCSISVMRDGKEETVTFRKVTVVGVHPSMDLALVRIDPKEHNVQLRPATIAKEKAITGQRVYAIGNPGSGGSVKLTKTITEGLLSGVDRVIDDVPYYQISAAINPGNSGGPLCDRTGKVLGLVTLKSSKLENVGFAIPLTDLELSQFKPMAARKVDNVRATQMIDIANQLVNRVNTMLRLKPKNNPEADLYRAIAIQVYHEALLANPRNPTVFTSIGDLYRSFEEYDAAEPYYQQALEIDPWGMDGRVYRSYGLLKLMTRKPADAETIWLEGVAKHPTNASLMWDDLSIFYRTSKDFASAAFCASVVVLQSGNSAIRRNEAMKTLNLCQASLQGTPDYPKINETVLSSALQMQARILRRNVHYVEQRAVITKRFADLLASQQRSMEALPPDVSRIVKVNTTKEQMQDMLAETRNDTALYMPGWTKEKFSLRSSNEDKARLAKSGRVPKEYDLVFELERKAGNKDVAVSFTVNDQPSVFLIDAFGGKSGIAGRRDGIYDKAVLMRNTPVTLTISVRSDKLYVSAGGKIFFETATTSPLPPAPEKFQVTKELPWILETNQSEFIVHGWWVLEHTARKATPQNIGIATGQPLPSGTEPNAPSAPGTTPEFSATPESSTSGSVSSSFPSTPRVRRGTVGKSSTGDAVTEGGFREYASFPELSWPVKCIAFSPDGKLLAAGKLDQVVMVFDVVNKRRVLTTDRMNDMGQITAIAFSPSGGKLIIGGSTGKISVYETADNGLLTKKKDYLGHSQEVLTICVSEDGKRVLSGGQDKRIRCWDLENCRDFCAFDGFDREVKVAAFAENGEKGYATDGNTIMGFDIAKGEISGSVRTKRTSSSRAVGLSQDGQTMVTLDSHEIRFLKCATGELFGSIQHEGYSRRVSFSPDNRFVFVSISGGLNVYDFQKRQKIAFLAGPSDILECSVIAMTRDSRLLAMMPDSSGQTLKIFEVPGK